MSPELAEKQLPNGKFIVRSCIMWLSHLSLKNCTDQCVEPRLESKPSGPCVYVGAGELKIMRVAVFAAHVGCLFCTELAQLH